MVFKIIESTSCHTHLDIKARFINRARMRFAQIYSTKAFYSLWYIVWVYSMDIGPLLSLLSEYFISTHRSHHIISVVVPQVTPGIPSHWPTKNRVYLTHVVSHSGLTSEEKTRRDDVLDDGACQFGLSQGFCKSEKYIIFMEKYCGRTCSRNTEGELKSSVLSEGKMLFTGWKISANSQQIHFANCSSVAQ